MREGGATVVLQGTKHVRHDGRWVNGDISQAGVTGTTRSSTDEIVASGLHRDPTYAIGIPAAGSIARHNSRV